MVQTVERRVSARQVFEALADGGPLSTLQLAAQLDISERLARRCVRELAETDIIARDEFGRYATWCAWPRVGL